MTWANSSGEPTKEKSPSYDELSAITTEKILNPSVGDRFNEMYSFWMYVVKIGEEFGEKIIYTAHFNPPCDVSAEGCREIYKHTQKGFEKHYFYDSEAMNTKSWLLYTDNKLSDVENMLEEYIKLDRKINDYKFFAMMLNLKMKNRRLRNFYKWKLGRRENAEVG